MFQEICREYNGKNTTRIEYFERTHSVVQGILYPSVLLKAIDHCDKPHSVYFPES